MESINKNNISFKTQVTVISVLIHAILFLSIMAILRVSDNKYGFSGVIEIGSVKGIPSSEGDEGNSNLPKNERELESQKEDKALKEQPEKKHEEKDSRTSELLGSGSSSYGTVEGSGFDSTNLSQVYHESTLNVRMKYPAGWVYIDQQRKKKLDGITFWSEAANYNPPPYIHVEVTEKYRFNPQRYKYKFDFDKFIGYYNPPEELENQITQEIYIRTDEEEDFTIKLIINGKQEFERFQPTFFSIIKSFDFGKSLF